MSWARQIGARAFIAGMAIAALGCFTFAFFHWQSTDPVKFVCYLVAALLASSFKVSLPGIEGTLSMNFLFTLIGILEMSLPETLLIGLVSTLAQFYWRPARRLKPVQLVFNLVARDGLQRGRVRRVQAGFHSCSARSRTAGVAGGGDHALPFGTVAMSIIIGLTEDKPIPKVWSESYLWSFPYYLVGAAIAGLVSFLNRHIGWQASLLVLPPIYLMYRSYRLYLGKLEDGKAARGKSFQPASANHRGAGAGDRGQGSNHGRAPATGSHLRHGTGAGAGIDRGRNRSAAGCLGAARHWEAGGAGTHHLQAGQAHAGRIREDEDPSHRWERRFWSRSIFLIR